MYAYIDEHKFIPKTVIITNISLRSIHIQFIEVLWCYEKIYEI